MALPPHLHLLLPSSSPQVYLEARLYIPLPSKDTSQDGALPVSRATRSNPIKLDSLSSAVLAEVYALQIERLVIASHPWAKLGGNMLDPVITHHLLSSAFDDGTTGRKTAVLSFNVRGNGHSQGSAPLLTVGHELEDFAAIEKAGLALCSAQSDKVEARRFGYSWGCTAALAAPLPPQGVKGVFLVSPAFVANRPLGWITTTVSSALKVYLSPKGSSGEDTAIPNAQPRVHMIYGTADQFTSDSTYRGVVSEHEDHGLLCVRVEKADHFWRGDLEGNELDKTIRHWLET